MARNMNRSTKDPWYFPRGDLTAHVFSLFQSGLVRRLALFAPRRKGKTWFLVRDLAPAATKRKWIPVYASLWDNMDAPQVPILEALDNALSIADRQRIPWRRHLSGIQKVGLTAGAISVAWRPQLSNPSNASKDELVAIGGLLRRLVDKAPDGRVLFMLDEAQHLATHPRFLPLIAALRTALDTLEAAGAGNIRTLFTGSSRTNLDALVRDPKSPFYRSTEQIVMPELGQDYTRHIVSQLRRIGKISVKHDECERVFIKLDRSPYYMERVVRELMLRRADSLAIAFRNVMDDIVNDPYNKLRWNELKPLDRLVYQAVCEKREVYGEEQLKVYGKALGQSVGASLVQRSIERLSKANLVSSRKRGDYQNEDPELLAWLRNTSN